MSKKHKKRDARAASAAPHMKMTNKDYERHMRVLQGELVAMQEWVKTSGAKICLVFEGLDSAGEGGTIRRITERTSPRGFKHIALDAPTERVKSQIDLHRSWAHFPRWGVPTHERGGLAPVSISIDPAVKTGGNLRQ